MNDKIKRRLAIAGALVISLALVIAIGMQFAKEPAKPDAFSQEPVSSSDVAPDIQKNTEKKEIVVPPQTALELEVSETLPPQTDLPEQKLQPDPVKPEAPKKPELPKDADTKNPSKLRNTSRKMRRRNRLHPKASRRVAKQRMVKFMCLDSDGSMMLVRGKVRPQMICMKTVIRSGK